MSGKVIDVFLITADIACEWGEWEWSGGRRANSVRSLRGSTERRIQWRQNGAICRVRCDFGFGQKAWTANMQHRIKWHLLKTGVFKTKTNCALDYLNLEVGALQSTETSVYRNVVYYWPVDTGVISPKTWMCVDVKRLISCFVLSLSSNILLGSLFWAAWIQSISSPIYLFKMYCGVTLTSTHLSIKHSPVSRFPTLL